jgi:hypothetical protein
MKRIMILMLGAMLVTSVVAFAQETKKEEAKPAPVTLTGEVIDLYCYMSHPASATGAEHMKCAQGCMKKGLPVGFLAADGTVYLIIGKEHEPVNATLADWAGKKSAVTGVVQENKSMKAIEFASIAEAK